MAVEQLIERGELRWLPLEQLHPNSYNPNQMDSFMYAKERESIKRFGMVAPVVARVTGKESFEIIDGENRWKVAGELGIDPIPVFNVGLVSDADAKQLTIILNETHGSPEREKLQALLRDLLTSEPTESLLGVLPFSKEAFDELLDLPKFDWEQFEKPQQIGDGWVERTYRLPREVAKLLDQAIARAKEDQEVPDAVALERIAAEFLSGS